MLLFSRQYLYPNSERNVLTRGSLYARSCVDSAPDSQKQGPARARQGSQARQLGADNTWVNGVTASPRTRPSISCAVQFAVASLICAILDRCLSMKVHCLTRSRTSRISSKHAIPKRNASFPPAFNIGTRPPLPPTSHRVQMMPPMASAPCPPGAEALLLRASSTRPWRRCFAPDQSHTLGHRSCHEGAMARKGEDRIVRGNLVGEFNRLTLVAASVSKRELFKLHEIRRPFSFSPHGAVHGPTHPCWLSQANVNHFPLFQ
jgi:hypothetical protein